jgi:hypothetical protein
MQKFSVISYFTAHAKASMPDPEKPNSFRPLEFDCKFKTSSNDPDSRESLRKKEREDGPYAFLDSQLLEVKYKGEFEFTDEDGSPLTDIEFTKRNQITCTAAILAFWDVVGRDVEAKNSKRSR